MLPSWPWLFLEEQVSPCLAQAACASRHRHHPWAALRQRTMADGRGELSVGFRRHHPHPQVVVPLLRFFTEQILGFQPDLSMWKTWELSDLVFLFFEVIRLNMTHELWGCDSGFFVQLLKILMLFKLKVSRKLMKKHSCKVKPVKWTVPEATSEGK